MRRRATLLFHRTSLFVVVVVAASLAGTSHGQGNFFGNLGRQLGLDLGPPHRHGAPPDDPSGHNHGDHPGGHSQGIGAGVEHLLDQMGLDPRLSHQLGATVQGISSQFFAPSPDSPIPPHVQRRIMRFCANHPDHPKCRERPEWNVPSSQIPPEFFLGGGRRPSIDLNEAFPNFIPFKVPPIPLPRPNQLRDWLAGVPLFLRNLVPPAILGQIDEAARRSIQSRCRSPNACRQQRPEWLNQRASLAEQEAAVHRLLNPHRTQELLDNDIETRLTRTHQIKKALLKNAGLSDKVEPANDGVFQQDLLLTEQQSNMLLNEINANQVSGAGRRRRKRSAIFGEENPTQLWSRGQPIPYYVDESLDVSEKSAIDAAVQEIQSKSCVTFKKMSQRPEKNFIYYVKIASSTFCGLSYIGRVDPANPIYLSFQCGNPTGVAIHETLHALGLNHEQLRSDRDEFIKIQWENVNPQNYDFFSIADGKLFTSYGVKYDYGSIMHYASTTAAQAPNLITMNAKTDTARNNALMGQRYGMAASDVEALRKLYCGSSGCDDKNVYCGAWASRNLCNTEAQKGWMIINCRKSCGFCT